MSKYLITPTLLNSFDYYLRDESDNQQTSRGDFLRILSREKSQPTEAMQKGIDLEKAIWKYTNTGEIDYDTESVVKEIGDTVKGGVWQYSCKADIEIGRKDFILYGKCDVINFDTIYDIKFTSNYDLGKYYNSAQHLIYLHCLNLPKFSYLISDGRSVWREDYYNDQEKTKDSIQVKVCEFIDYLSGDSEMRELYYNKWMAFN